jgi:hypothetical protein
VDLRNVGMIQRGQHLRLSLEPGYSFGVCGKHVRQHLQSIVAPECDVPRSPDLAHAPLAEEGNHLIGTHASAWADRHRDLILTVSHLRVHTTLLDRSDQSPRMVGAMNYLSLRRREFETTLRVLQAYPEELAQMRPAAKSRTAAELANAMANEERVITALIETGARLANDCVSTQDPDAPALIAPSWARRLSVPYGIRRQGTDMSSHRAGRRRLRSASGQPEPGARVRIDRPHVR